LTQTFIELEPQKFCAVVIDNKNYRADLYVSGNDLVVKLGSAKKGNKINITKCFINVNG